ncbi:hypothetical protein HHI36_010653 [Cryptolaemus montrouzieri]|uniref:Uncharacterized protein n=1 Tax=Cryptolaemus montrouzieri TaxID=559131 RepID=A0ABD2MJF0_9CUCU
MLKSNSFIWITSSPLMKPRILNTTKKQMPKFLDFTPTSFNLKKGSRSKSKIKTILIAFFGNEGGVREELVPQEQIVNAAYYMNMLELFQKRVFKTYLLLFNLIRTTPPATTPYESWGSC